MLDLRISETVEPKDLEANLRNSQKLMVNTFVKIWPHYSEIISSYIKKNVGKGGILKRRTGMLARATDKKDWLLQKKLLSFLITLRLAVPYGRIHEEGGTIVPKPPKKYLTIPLPPALTPAGVVKIRALRAKDPSLKEGLIRENKNKNLIIYLKEKGGIVPMWILKRSVVIPARRWFGKSVLQADKHLATLMAGEINKAYSATREDIES